MLFVGVWFVLVKRPIYEAMALGYLLVIALTRRWDLLVVDLWRPTGSALFFAIVAFLLLAHVLARTAIVEQITRFILAAVGWLPGGGGFVSLVGSTFMASLSGSGPGNAAAVGLLTIPTMKRTGFPAPLAASVEMAASSLGPMIPPSGTIFLAFGVLSAAVPAAAGVPISRFWLAVWGVGLWFVLQRALTLLAFCRVYGLRPIPAAERPGLRQTVREGWPALLLPVIIFVPFFADAYCGRLVALRIGEAGRRAFSRSVLLIAPVLALLYAVAISWRGLSGPSRTRHLLHVARESLSAVVPVSATVYFAYAIAFVFGDVDAASGVAAWLDQLGLGRAALAIFIPLFSAFLGMVLPGSSQIAILGGVLVTTMARSGLDPLLVAALLPSITGGLEGMTPPLALTMYVTMGIAGSGFAETSKLALIWVAGHLLVAGLLLFGLLPVWGTP